MLKRISPVEDLDRAAAASLFAQNPQLVNMIQGKLGSLVGRSSGYIESLPAVVRRRVQGLNGIHKEHRKLESEFQLELLELEKKYYTKYSPLYEKRAKIVNGTAEPSEEEIKAGEKDEDKEEKDDVKSEPAEEGKDEADVKGIPEFWLSTMKNHVSLAELITDQDAPALKHLSDIRLEYFDKPGFRLVFEFADNDFFKNKTITKTYIYREEVTYSGEYIYDHAEGDKIDWKEGKDLTKKIEQKKQRNKNTKQTRIIKKTVPTESFFNFFDPPANPSGEDKEDDPEIEERLELDYQLGEDIKEKLIPRAIDWFTGEALQYEGLDEDDLAEGDFEDEDDEEDDELSEDRDEDEESDDEVGDLMLQHDLFSH